MVYKFDYGFDYPEYFEYFRNAVASIWRPEEVALESDLRDWQHNTTQAERDLIAGVLRGFTSAELGIGCHWGTEICRIFPKPEIQAMARMFSAFEQIHAHAYNYLSDTLGLNEFEEFISDPIAKQKVERFFSECESEKVGLAFFGGAGEGVSLFSSFAILLSFCKDGRFKGIQQIISWSIIDEISHSDGASQLFRDLVAEVGITEAEINEIYEGFQAVIGNEFSFLDNIFASPQAGALPIELDDVKAYIKHRANDRLKNLGLEPRIVMTDQEVILARRVADWFEPMAKGQVSHDFFARAKAGDSYVAKPTQNYEAVDLSTLTLELV